MSEEYDFNFKVDESFAKEMDMEDELAGFRERFYIPPRKIYMDGNSLGLLSKDAECSLLRVLNEWKDLAISGWLEAKPPWFYFAEELGKLQAPLVGAGPDEVIVTGSTTTNLHNLIATFYRPEGRRKKILADELNFPSDIYAISSQLRLHGMDPKKDLILVKSRDGRTIEEEDVVEAMNEEVALIILPSVLYRSGQLLDIKYLTNEAHKRGIPIGFDCCHSIGAVPHKLSEWEVDFAFWCNYKYMNNGPGGVASLYINRKHFDKEPGFAGWWGYNKERQFDMLLEFEGAEGAGAWQIGTIHILSAAPLEGSLKIFNEAGIDRIRNKSVKQTSYLIYLIETLLSCPPYNFRIGTPKEPWRRGGHVAVEHETEAVRINEALKKRGVIPDFRFPNVIRLAPVALYNTYHEIWKAVHHLKAIVDLREYEGFSGHRGPVA